MWCPLEKWRNRVLGSHFPIITSIPWIHTILKCIESLINYIVFIGSKLTCIYTRWIVITGIYIFYNFYDPSTPLEFPKNLVVVSIHPQCAFPMSRKLGGTLASFSLSIIQFSEPGRGNDKWKISRLTEAAEYFRLWTGCATWAYIWEELI